VAFEGSSFCLSAPIDYGSFPTVVDACRCSPHPPFLGRDQDLGSAIQAPARPCEPVPGGAKSYMVDGWLRRISKGKDLTAAAEEGRPPKQDRAQDLQGRDRYRRGDLIPYPRTQGGRLVKDETGVPCKSHLEEKKAGKGLLPPPRRRLCASRRSG